MSELLQKVGLQSVVEVEGTYMRCSRNAIR